MSEFDAKARAVQAVEDIDNGANRVSVIQAAIWRAYEAGRINFNTSGRLICEFEGCEECAARKRMMEDFLSKVKP